MKEEESDREGKREGDSRSWRAPLVAEQTRFRIIGDLISGNGFDGPALLRVFSAAPSQACTFWLTLSLQRAWCFFLLRMAWLAWFIVYLHAAGERFEISSRESCSCCPFRSTVVPTPLLKKTLGKYSKYTYIIEFSIASAQFERRLCKLSSWISK